MKAVTQEYIDKEQASERKPAELFHIWRDGGENWYYTSGDVSFDYGGNTYTPVTIERSEVTYNSKLEAQTMTIKATYLEDATTEFLSINPVEILWVSCMKIHRDLSPVEVSVVFIGQIKGVSFKGVDASAQCVGFEHFLKKTIPTWRYQRTCNHDVFDSLCGLTKASYLTTATVSLDSTNLILSSATFATQDDGYFVGGEVVFGVESRTIISHIGSDIKIIYKFVEDVDGQSVNAYPGCDGRAETCRDKYSNINNFLGFPFIPSENPALRASW